MMTWIRRLARTLGRRLSSWGSTVPMGGRGFPWPAGRDAAIERELIVSNAVRLAMVLDCGLAADTFLPSHDLQRTGKLQEVIYHAARRLDVNPGLTTVADVIALLQHAMKE